MTATTSTLRLSLPDGSLHVDFVWQQDRFVHEFVLPDGSRVASVEGTASQPWPPSPPLQQLSRELINDAYAILGVGAAGQSHWSISVEISQYGQRPALKFDVACRSATPQWLGSTYQLSNQLRWDVAADSTIGENDLCVVQPTGERAGKTLRWGYWVSAKQ